MRIWFNRGFSLAPIAAAMRASDPGVEVFASVGPYQTQHEGPTATWIEPDATDCDYLAWTREMVTTNAIDILIPTRRRSLIAAAQLDCRVELPADIATLDLLDDKFAFAASLADKSYHLASRLIQSSDELVATLAAFGGECPADAAPCIKPRRGVNGHGFWRLQTDKPMSHLISPDDRKIFYPLYIRAIVEAEAAQSFEDLILMEYLPGPEISLDILAHEGTLLKLAARTKLAGGLQQIETEHFLRPIAEELVEQFALSGIVNAQFRRARGGDWKVLEINARPAGGIVYSEKVGCDLLADWVALLTGKKLPSQIVEPRIDARIRKMTAITKIAA